MELGNVVEGVKGLLLDDKGMTIEDCVRCSGEGEDEVKVDRGVVWWCFFLLMAAWRAGARGTKTPAAS
jgi:hypothetical protein